MKLRLKKKRKRKKGRKVFLQGCNETHTSTIAMSQQFLTPLTANKPTALAFQKMFLPGDKSVKDYRDQIFSME